MWGSVCKASSKHIVGYVIKQQRIGHAGKQLNMVPTANQSSRAEQLSRACVNNRPLH